MDEQKVYVVMGNDDPIAVFDKQHEQHMKAYCEVGSKNDLMNTPRRFYEVVVNPLAEIIKDGLKPYIYHISDHALHVQERRFGIEPGDGDIPLIYAHDIQEAYTLALAEAKKVDVSRH